MCVVFTFIIMLYYWMVPRCTRPIAQNSTLDITNIFSLGHQYGVKEDHLSEPIAPIFTCVHIYIRKEMIRFTLTSLPENLPGLHPVGLGKAILYSVLGFRKLGFISFLFLRGMLRMLF